MKAVFAALLFVLACGKDATAPTPGSRTYCPHTFAWRVVDSAYDYEQEAREITRNTYRMTLQPDSLVRGEGGFYVNIWTRIGADSGVVEYLVLWPFVGYYLERADTLFITYSQIWLERSDVLTRFARDGLLTESLDPTVSLELVWGRC